MAEHFPEIDIRYTTLDDTQYLRDWLTVPGELHWFPMSEEKELDDAVQCWMGFSKWSCSLTATLDGVPCGIATLFLMPYRKVAHHCLFKIIVDPKQRRKGIGFSLLKNLKHLARNYFRLHLMHIEVYEGNPLIELLKKLDFQEYARQENFIKEGNRYYSRVLLESYLR